MAAEAEVQAPRGLGHVSVWLHDPDFWRDVASRALATAVVALVAYLLALIGGVLARPAIWHIVVGLVLLVAGGVVALFGGRWAGRLTGGARSSKARVPVNLGLVLTVSGLVVVAAILLAPA